MHVFLLGVSHQTAPIDIREQLDFSSRDVGAAVEALAARYSAGEAVVLSTCNRSEIYVASDDPTRARQELIDFLGTYHRLPPQAFEAHVFEHTDEDATRHLFRVAAGLDSLVVGEPQILGQVKDAFQVAAKRHCVGPVLTRLFHSSFGVGKRVRSETALGEGAISVGFAAVALARKIFGRLDGRGVLVVGAGEISTLTAQHLRAQGVGDIAITSRTAAHAQVLAVEVDGRAIPWSDLRAALATADIVITATGSPRPILTRADIEAVTSRRRGEQLFIIDIAVPRDVEPSVGEIEQVFLYNVDDLQAIVQENLSRRSSEIDRAESIVGEEVERFAAWRRSRGAVPTVVALRQRFEQIRRAELQRLEHKLGGLSPEARAGVDEVTRLIVEKLLLSPTAQLKALPDEETQIAYTEAISRLFELRDESPVGPAADEVDAAPPNRTRS
jgi:glutamyl-tRNA reductase